MGKTPDSFSFFTNFHDTLNHIDIQLRMGPMNNPKIMITKGDETLYQSLKNHLAPHRFEIIETIPETHDLQFFQRRRPDLVIIGASGPDPEDGLALVDQIRHQNRTVPIILITRHGSEARAIAAFRAGVSDYFKKPFTLEEVTGSIERHLSACASSPSEKPTSIVAVRKKNMTIIGNSAPMREITNTLARVAVTDSTVLITGETGTGKELAAEFIHRNSQRHRMPFICINCGALPENLIESEMFGYERGAFTGAVTRNRGKFELANRGTVFLDEIADMSPFAQAKILRTIENKEIHRLGGKKFIPLDVRVVSATNKDPEELIGEGKFREDLYYRLNVVRMHLPPLRERKEDIPALVAHGIKTLNRRFNCNVQGLTDEATASLMRYDWPGNVRELMNVLEATFVNHPRRKIGFPELPKQLQQKLRGGHEVPDNERKNILSVLMETKWNKATAARKLNWSRMTLYRKIAKYNIVQTRNPPR